MNDGTSKLLEDLKAQRDELNNKIIHIINEQKREQRQKALENFATLMAKLPWKLNMISMNEIEIHSYINDIGEQGELLEICEILNMKEGDVIRLASYGKNGMINGPNMVRTEYTQLCILFNNPMHVSTFIHEYKLKVRHSNIDDICKNISALQEMVKTLCEMAIKTSLQEGG